MIKDIMVVDDNKIDLFISQKIIGKYDSTINTRVFTSGISALNFLKIAETIKGPSTIVTPDIILLDINMPLMDGFQFIKEFKKMGLGQKKSIKIFMLSSSLYIEDINKANEEDFCEGYITKPITVEKLRDLNDCKYFGSSEQFSIQSFLSLL